MENKSYAVKKDELQVVDGKVVINSDELAAAIVDFNLNLSDEEMADDVIINFFCPPVKVGL